MGFSSPNESVLLDHDSTYHRFRHSAASKGSSRILPMFVTLSLGIFHPSPLFAVVVAGSFNSIQIPNHWHSPPPEYSSLTRVALFLFTLTSWREGRIPNLT